MDPVVHFEMPAADTRRAAKFYSDAFGWNMKQMGADMGHYLLAGTTETDANRMVKTPGNINGGFYPISSQSGHITTVVISVQNLSASMEKVKKAGGQIIGEPMEIPDIGRFVSIMDSEGNKVGMLQPKMP